MNIAGRMKKIAITIATAFTAAATMFGAPSDKPKITDTLNDFNPEYPVGIYIQEIASNQIVTAVQLTNGVLTIDGESINIAQPSHDVIATNFIYDVSGVITNITTNTYHTVYEDGLEKTLKEYATKEKIGSIVTNELGEVTTNWTKVAYLSDIPPDEKKADKIMEAWEFFEPNLGLVLSRNANTNSPFAYWRWEGDEGVLTSIDLFFKDAKWNVSRNEGVGVSVDGELTNDVVSVDGFTFIATNKTEVMVVYSDQLKDAVSGKLDQYLAKTNLVPIAEQITEERLQTIDGIADTLRGIKQVVTGITGIPTVSFTFSPPSQNFRCEVLGADMVIPGDQVEIDWGDGSAGELVSLPTNHVYSGYAASTLTVTIKGFVKGFNGTDSLSGRPFIYLYDLDSTSDNYGALKSVRIDSSMPLESIGDYAFYGCLGMLGDLSFVPASVTNIGTRCFARSGITSLTGMPLGITTISYACFENTPIKTLQGISPNITEIQANAFSDSSLLSLDGIPPSVRTIGEGCFFRCGSLVAIGGLRATRIENIPEDCFSQTGITSVDGIPDSVTTIGAHAFSSCGSLTSISGLPRNIVRIEGNCFSECPLVSVDFSSTGLMEIENSVFDDCTELTSIIFPSSITTMSTALDGGGGSNPLSVTLIGKDMESITNANGFAWGLRNSGQPPGASVFIATDGQLVSDGSGGWTANLTSTAFSLTGLQSGQRTIVLGEIEPTQMQRGSKHTTLLGKRDTTSIAPGTYSIDWGDGSPLDSASSHTYNFSTKTNITIKVLGALDSISGSQTMPFLSVDGNPTNHYLTGVNFGGAVGIKTIGIGAFRNCTSLSGHNIKGIGHSLTSLGDECFAYCTSLTNATHLNDSSLTALPNGCFRGANLVGIGASFSRDITAIGENCFRDCTNLVTATSMASNLSSIGSYAFYGCNHLRDIDFISSTSVTEIPNGCFQNCSSLTNLPSLEGIVRIGSDAFANASKLVDFSLPRGLTIGDRAFYGCGTDPSIPVKVDEDGFEFKLLFSCAGMSYVDVAQAFGLQDGDVFDTRTGVDPTITKFECANGDLLFNNGEQIRRWEVIVPAIEFELSQVPNGKTFTVSSTRAYDGASLVWNWGDGTTDRWITKAPPSHTYTNDAPRNYVVKVKGLLQSISSTSAEAGAYIRPIDSAENPYLVGFKISEETPLQAIGSHTFSRCPNLKNINTTNLPRARGAPIVPAKRDPSKTRLENLSASMTRGVVTYGEGCFARSGIEMLSGLPADLAKLERSIFAYNTNLASIATLPKYIVDVEEEAFRGDGKLQNLDGWPSSVGYISPYCFAECSGLTSLYGLEEAPITSIGEGAFYGCTNLTSLYGLPQTVETIGAGAFQGSAISSLSYMPTSVTNIAEAAFAQCFNITTIDGISTNVVSLPSMAFIGCTNLRNIVSLSESLLEIGDLCFVQLPNLTNVVLGANIKTIGVSALGGCGADVEPQPDLDGNMISCTITFPSLSIEDIRTLWETNFSSTLSSTKLVGWNGYIAFRDGEWKNFSNTITFTISVRSGAEVRLGAMDIEEGYGFSLLWGDEDNSWQESSNGFSHVYSRAGTYNITLVGRINGIASDAPPRPFLYSTNSVITISSISVGNNVGLSYLGESCFRGYSAWTNLIDMAGTSISMFGPNCFEGCSSLKNLSGIPLSLCTISTGAFKNCSGLEDISALTNSVVYSIGESAFENCTNLKSIVGLGSFVTNIPDRCFYNCKSITSLEGLPHEISIIGNEAFSYCSSLRDISSISNSIVEGIGRRAFANCESLIGIEGCFPSGLSRLGEGCFYGCSGLATLNGWSVNVLSLPPSCFENCTSLHSITGLPPFVAIGESCFAGCSSLSDGTGYKTSQGYVDDSTFKGCSTLTSISFIDNEYSILGASSFQGCSNLTSITVPISITNVAMFSFADCVSLSNLVLQTSDIVLSSNSLSNIGIANTVWKDEFGNSTKAVVWMKENTVDEILTKDNFPFGAPLATTVFVGKDGTVYGAGKYRDALELDVSVLAGDKFWLGDMVATSGGKVSVSWGDGFGTNNISSGGVDHVYQKPGTYTIKISGDLDSINGTGLNRAFLAKYNGTSFVPQNTALKAVRVPSVSSLSKIGSYAFTQCSAVTNVSIANGKVSKIGDYALFGCIGINEFDYGDSPIASFGKYAFSETSFFNNLDWIPTTLKEIGSDCFNGCTHLTDIGSALEDRPILTIGDRAFGGCTSLGANAIMQYWPSSISVVGPNMFENCSLLSRLYIQNTCTGIRANALREIGALAQPIADETGREYRAFVFITHKTCAEVMSAVFSGASSSAFPFGARTDTKFICSDGYISYETRNWNVHQFDMTIMLADVTAGSTVTIQNTTPAPGETITWSFGDGIVLENVTTYPISHTYSTASSTYQISAVGHIEAINGTSTKPWITISSGKVKSVTVNESCAMKDIGAYSFNGLSNIETVNIFSRVVTNIGTYAFAQCKDMREVRFPQNGSKYRYPIGASAFEGCESLINVTLAEPYMCSSIGARAFKDCKSLQEVNVIFPYSTSLPIGEDAFSGIGTSSAISSNEYGFLYRTRIGVSQHLENSWYFSRMFEADELRNSSSNLWGAPTNTIFTSADGFVGYDSSWKSYEYAIKSETSTGSKKYSFIKNGIISGGDIIGGAVSVKIGNMVDVTEIADGAFSGNSLLVTISKSGTAPCSPSRVGRSAFLGCGALANVPSGFGAEVLEIGDDGFRGCQSLKIEQACPFGKCRKFGARALMDCKAMTSIDWMNPNAVLSEACFQACESLSSLLGFPTGGDRNVPKKCFYRCSSLPSLSGLAPNVTNIDTWAFASCSNLLSLTGIPSSLVSIGPSSFGDVYDPDYWPDNFHMENARYEGGIVVLPSTLKRVNTESFGNNPKICENIMFDLGDAVLSYFNHSSFDGGASYVRSLMTLAQLEQAYEKSSISVFGSDIVATDGVFTREAYQRALNLDVYYRYVAKKSTSMPLWISIGKFQSDRHVLKCEGFGKTKYMWGDGAISSGPTTHTYVDCDRSVIFFVPDKISSIPTLTSTTGPIVRDIDGTNQYVNSVFLGGSITTIGDYSLIGLTKCYEITIESSQPSIGRSAFSGLGSELPESSLSGFPFKCKSMVRMPNVDVATLRAMSNFPFGAPTSTAFVTCDGAIYYDRSAWKNYLMYFSATAKWAERPNKGESYNFRVKQRDYPIYTPWGWIPSAPLPESVRDSWFYISEEQYNYLNDVGVDGHGHQIVLAWQVHYTGDEEGMSDVFFGPFYFANNKSGEISIDNGERVRITSGQMYRIPHPLNNEAYGYVQHSVKVFGNIERIENFIHQATVPQGLPPAITSLDLSKCHFLKCIHSFANVSQSPANSHIPNSVEEFGVGCFENRRDIYSLKWIPTSLKGIPDRCFSGCSNLSSLYGIERCTKLTSLGSYCFSDCTALSGTLEMQKSNSGCFPASITTIGISPFHNVCFGKPSNILAICMRGKTIDQILGFSHVEWSARQAEVGGDGSTGRVLWYGTDGYIQDMAGNGSSFWKKVRQNTGL